MSPEIIFESHDLDRIRESFPPEEGPLLAADIDNSTNWLSQVVIQRFSRLTGIPLAPSQIDGFGCLTRLLVEHGWDKEEARRFQIELWNDQNDQFNAPPAPGAVEVITAIHDLGLDVFFPTSRPHKNRDCTIAWIEETFPGLGSKQVRIRNDDEAEQSGSFWKARQIARWQPWFAVEDNVRHAKEIYETTSGKTQVLLFPYRLGQQSPIFGNLVRTGRLHPLRKNEDGSPDFWDVYQTIRRFSHQE